MFLKFVDRGAKSTNFTFLALLLFSCNLGAHQLQPIDPPNPGVEAADPKLQLARFRAEFPPAASVSTAG